MTDLVEDLRMYIDNGIKAQDDFYDYANGKWLAKTEIPEDKARFGAFTELRDLSRDNVKDLLSQSFDDPEMKKATMFYKTGTDMERRNREDYEPIKTMIEKIESISSVEDLKAVINHMAENGSTPLISFSSLTDRKDTTKEVPHVSIGGLSLPGGIRGGGNKDYYFDEDKADAREKFVEMLTTLFGYIGSENAAERAKIVLEMETKMADKHYTQVEKRDPDLSYNPYEYGDLKNTYSNFDWDGFTRAYTNTELSKVVLNNPKLHELLEDMLISEDLSRWKSYLVARLILSAAPYLSERFENTHFDFYGKTLSGQKEKEVTWKRVLDLLNSRFMVGELIGKIFVKEHFPPEAKAKMSELVANLRAVLAERIKNLDWMGEETKEKALYKLSKFNVKIGYPDVWENYNDLDIDESDSYLTMIRKTGLFHRNISMARLYKGPDRNRWSMSPQTVNAYYSPLLNEIVFPAAILRFPFFDLNMSMAENFGGIGMVIGHEISHGFDDKGSQFDADGNLKMWWTADDRAKFEEKTEHFIKEYENFLVNGKPLNGKLTLGENIGDHGGVKISYYAMQKYYETNPREDDEDITAEQKFFLSFARIWRGKSRPEFEERMRLSDPHSHAKARINVTLSNIGEFYEAFNVKEGDKMYRPELPNLW